MKYSLIIKCLMAVALFVGAAVMVHAQVSRDRYTVVRARELAEAPQRYWSRGIVFEDVLEDISGRGRRSAGRSFSQIQTETVGPCYVDEAIMGQVQNLRKGRRYLFSGTVLSETRRGFLFIRPSVQYFVAIDSVERLPDDVDADLLEALFDEEPDRPAFQNIQKALTQAQNQLVAFAQSEDVDIATLFDPRAETMDKAAEVSRVAVRELERELGITSTEMLGLLVRELLAAQYLETKPVRKDVPAVPATEEPEEAEAVELLPEPQPEEMRELDTEKEPVELEADDAEEQIEIEEEAIKEPEEAEIMEEEEEDTPRRRGWFRRRTEPEEDEPGAEEDEPGTEEEEKEQEEDSEPTPRGWFRRRPEPQSEEPEPEEMPQIEEPTLEKLPEIEEVKQEELIDESVEEAPSARRGFFRRRSIETPDELEEDVAKVIEVEEVEEESPAPSRSWRSYLRFEAQEKEATEPEEEVTVQEKEDVPESEPARRPRRREILQSAPAEEAELPPRETDAIQLPVKRF